MKKIILVNAFLLFISLGAYAQNGQMGGGRNGGNQQTPQQRAQTTVTNLTAQITVTSVQKDSLTAIFTRFYTNMQIYRTQGNMDALKTLKSTRDQRVQAVLANDKLYAQYQQWMASQKQQWQGGKGGQNNYNGGNNNPGN